MSKEIHHFYVHAQKKMVVLKILKGRLQQLNQTINGMDDFIQSSIEGFEQTGSLADKKNALLAEVENTKHRLHFRFLLGLAHLMENALRGELEVLQQLSEKYL